MMIRKTIGLASYIAIGHKKAHEIDQVVMLRREGY